MKPIVAVVGRPNVGKSTLVNRIAQTSDAIVHESRGVTRDRSYYDADWSGHEFTPRFATKLLPPQKKPMSSSSLSMAPSALPKKMRALRA